MHMIYNNNIIEIITLMLLHISICFVIIVKNIILRSIALIK